MLAADALTDAANAYRLIQVINGLFSTGRANDEDEARELLSELARRCEPEIAVLLGIAAAHRQAAEVVNLVQRAGRRHPAPYPNAANDTHTTTPSAPSLA